MKSGFTLIEILVALLIVGIIVGSAVVNFGAGVKSAHMADATRAVQQYAGHARAVALLKQRPVVLTIEEISENGVFVESRISTAYGKDAVAEGAGASGGAGFAVGSVGGEVRTLSGVSVGASANNENDEDDPLSSEPRDIEGVHVRAVLKEETEQRRTRISVFSTADLLLRKNRERQDRARAKREENGEIDSSNGGEASEQETDQETKFSVVYEPNGRCDPYTVKIWKDGADEDKAIELQVNRFGKVIEEEER